MEEAQQILGECGQLLAAHRQQLERLLGDPRVSEWRRINFEVHGELLHALGVAAGVGKAATLFHEQADSLFERLDSGRNELANQKTDLQFNAAAPERVLAAAKELARECSRLAPPLAKLQSQFTVMCQADKTLRQKLRLESLINLAEEKSGVKSDTFNAGYRVFALATGIGTAPRNDRNFQEQFAEATELKTRLQHVDLDNLPCLAAGILDQQIAFAIDTVEQIKNILDHAQQSLSYELDTVRRLNVQMAELAMIPLPEIMKNLNEVVAGLSDCLLNFSHKQHIVKRLQAVTVILDHLKLFNRALRSEVLTTLKTATRKPGSPLNPATLAARNAEKYFAGLTGFWRMIKLYFQATGGDKALDGVSLQLALEKAIGTCTAYRGSQEVDLKNLHAFIASRLEGYRKPFPHDELSRLMKATLDAYTVRVEKSLHGQLLGPELLREFSAGTPYFNAGSLTFGKLLQEVQRRTDNLKRGLF